MAQPPPPPEEEQQQQQRGLVLPGYKYLGPLNSLNRGLPRNQLDAAAKKHDEQYHKITDYFKKTKNRKVFEERVRQADREFLSEVQTFTPQNTYDQVASWLATGGIGSKYLLEQCVGVLYPNCSDDEAAAYEIASMETMNANSVVGGGVRNNVNVHHFQFRKKFTFAIQSTKAEYSKNNADTVYKTYIHSLPWQYLYFYLTEKEYQDMTTIFHTSKVTGVGIKITNLGNRTPFITSANAVNYANANSQTTIGIWENLERTMPVKMGNNITPEDLYGKQIKDLATGDNKDPEHSTAQAKIIDNTITYNIKNTMENFHLPPLIMEATILYNATNSIGPIYEKDYTPKDGTFHTNNERILDAGKNAKVIRTQAQSSQMAISTGQMETIHFKPSITKKYKNATVDNINIGDIFGSAQQGFMPSLGVGIVPLLNADASLEKSILNIMVETFINLECTSHGTNLLMAANNKPQPNTNYMRMAVDKTWANTYTLAGAAQIE